MAKKTGKVILWGLVVGAAAAGIYHYLQNKDKAAEAYDEFDDFDNFEDAKENTEEKDRNYVSLNLDNAKAFVNETFDKAKEAFSKVSRNFQKADEDTISIIDDETSAAPEEEPAEEETADDSQEKDTATTEDFFDDNED